MAHNQNNRQGQHSNQPPYYDETDYTKDSGHPAIVPLDAQDPSLGYQPAQSPSRTLQSLTWNDLDPAEGYGTVHQLQAEVARPSATGHVSQLQDGTAGVLTGDDMCGYCRSHRQTQCIRHNEDEFCCLNCNRLDGKCSLGQSARATAARRSTKCKHCRTANRHCMGMKQGACSRCKRKGWSCEYPERAHPRKCLACSSASTYSDCDLKYGVEPCTPCRQRYEMEYPGCQPDSQLEAGCREVLDRAPCRRCKQLGIECSRVLRPECQACWEAGLHCDYHMRPSPRPNQ
jgi:hypothetical protein